MKPRSSKLDQFAAQLADLDAEKKTLSDICEWLASEGCRVSPSRVSEYLERLRSERREAAILAQITNGARQSAEVEKQFAKNPAPDLETLIKLNRVLIMQLSTQAVDNPELLKVMDSLTQTVLQFLSAQTKAAHKEREVTLAETKAAEAKKDDAAKALEGCLDEAKKFPDVQELFRQAFAGLKKARGAK